MKYFFFFILILAFISCSNSGTNPVKKSRVYFAQLIDGKEIEIDSVKAGSENCYPVVEITVESKDEPMAFVIKNEYGNEIYCSNSFTDGSDKYRFPDIRFNEGTYTAEAVINQNDIVIEPAVLNVYE